MKGLLVYKLAGVGDFSRGHYIITLSSTFVSTSISLIMSFDPQSILKLDGYLEPFIPAITHRYKLFQAWKDKINNSEGSLTKFSEGYNKFGFNIRDNGEIVYREWAPNANEAVLIGEFSGTRRLSSRSR